MPEIKSTNQSHKTTNDFSDFLDSEESKRNKSKGRVIKVKETNRGDSLKESILPKILEEHLPNLREEDFDLEEKMITEWQSKYKKHSSQISPELLLENKPMDKYRKLIKTPFYIYPVLHEVKNKTQLVRAKTVAKLSPTPWAAKVSAACLLALIVSFYIVHLTPKQADKIIALTDRIIDYPIARAVYWVSDYILPPDNSVREEIAHHSKFGQKVLASFVADHSAEINSSSNGQPKTIKVKEMDILKQVNKVYVPQVKVLGVSYPPELIEENEALLAKVASYFSDIFNKMADAQVQLSLELDRKLDQLLEK